MELVLRDTNDALILSDSIFSKAFSTALVHQVVRAYAASARQGSRSQKSRATVVGSGRKPWRQKGTGRARSGSVKSPIWRSGGVAFAALPKDYSQKVNKKMYRGAMKSILSELIRQDRLIVVKNFSIAAPKTKLLIQKLQDMGLENALILTTSLEETLLLAARNLYGVEVQNIANMSPISLISYDKVVMTVDAIKRVEIILK